VAALGKDKALAVVSARAISFSRLPVLRTEAKSFGPVFETVDEKASAQGNA
jgi:hypothetical protein